MRSGPIRHPEAGRGYRRYRIHGRTSSPAAFHGNPRIDSSALLASRKCVPRMMNRSFMNGDGGRTNLAVTESGPHVAPSSAVSQMLVSPRSHGRPFQVRRADRAVWRMIRPWSVTGTGSWVTGTGVHATARATG